MTNSHKFPGLMRALHWAMAILVIGLLAMGIYMAWLPMEAPGKLDLYVWHRAFGVLAFLLIALRILTRWMSRRQVPAFPDDLPKHEKVAARSTHVFFYLALIILPVVGYVASSALPEFPGYPPLRAI